MTDGPEVDTIRRALADAAEAGLRAEGCPETSRIWDAQAGSLTPFERRAVVEHTTRCPVCAESWRVARELGAQTGGAPVRRPVRLRPWMAVAAAVLVAMGAWVLIPPVVEEGPPVLREGRVEPIRALVDPERSIPRSSFRLSWSPVAEGAIYVVRVTTESFEPLYTSDPSERTDCLVPPSALEGLSPGTRLMWQVEAVRIDGRRVSSNTFFASLE
jgi:hypothetical protein